MNLQELAPAIDFPGLATPWIVHRDKLLHTMRPNVF